MKEKLSVLLVLALVLPLCGCKLYTQKDLDAAYERGYTEAGLYTEDDLEYAQEHSYQSGYYDGFNYGFDAGWDSCLESQSKSSASEDNQSSIATEKGLTYQEFAQIFTPEERVALYNEYTYGIPSGIDVDGRIEAYEHSH